MLQENLQSLEGNLSTMETQMKELKNNLNTAYVALCTKRELIKSGVLERGGFLKLLGFNDDLDRLAFTPYDIHELSEIEVVLISQDCYGSSIRELQNQRW